MVYHDDGDWRTEVRTHVPFHSNQESTSSRKMLAMVYLGRILKTLYIVSGQIGRGCGAMYEYIMFGEHRLIAEISRTPSMASLLTSPGFSRMHDDDSSE